MGLAEQDKSTEHEASKAEADNLGNIEALRLALAEEKERAASYLASWQRAQADLINYKKRAQQESREAAESATSLLILSLLGIMDDFERAFAVRPAKSRVSSWSGWIDGIRLIYDKLKAVMGSRGLVEIEAKGQPFDPYLHEAVMRREGEEGMVIEETRKGYKLNDRVIRPSMVIVGHNRETEQARPQEE
jgi:molecular chaperone GrpE